ncbi:Phospholysine phosphohistidine inorganic pyrophosphate phosphatase [Nymphon striatum]|nr:Phospholysine phosphohistidine inorganic pyrophosphate phosphatase [Nymphon striatum]
MDKSAKKLWQSKPIKGVLLDISGVLLNGDQSIDGSVQAFERLKENGIPVRLVTNESSQTVDQLFEILKNAGFQSLRKEQIFSPIYATCMYLKEHGLRPHLLVHPNVEVDFSPLSLSNQNCVVIGDAGQSFSYENMNNAFRCLIGMDKPILISMGQGRYYSGTEGLLLDVGVFKTALEFACSTEAIVMGKPSKDFFMSAVDDMKLSAEEVVMVGDDIRNDVGGAQSCGIRGLLVRTGKFRPSDENDVVKPDEIVDNLAKAVSKILDVWKQ